MRMPPVDESGGTSKSEKREKEETDKSIIDPNSEILKSFRHYGAELDKRHDRLERIVKLNRDLTTESKRIIFLLHSTGRSREEKKVFSEAEKRLSNLVNGCLFKIGKELENEDPYMFLKGYTFGLQEFIEAYTYYHYLKEKTLKHWSHYQDLLRYPSSNLDGDGNEISTTLPPLDYFLGIADLTGELMRKCINSLGSGDLKVCFDTCEIVREIFAGFLYVSNHKSHHLSDKIRVVKQNVLKMEKVCHVINVRNKEFPGRELPHFINNLDEPEKAMKKPWENYSE